MVNVKVDCHFKITTFQDILWYTKKQGDAREHITSHLKRPEEQARLAEIAAIKQMEEDQLAVELGLALKKRRNDHQQLDEAEVNPSLLPLKS